MKSPSSIDEAEGTSEDALAAALLVGAVSSCVHRPPTPLSAISGRRLDDPNQAAGGEKREGRDDGVELVSWSSEH